MKKAEIISVGDELLSGQITDTNAAWISRSLREIGYKVPFRQTCGDQIENVKKALSLALSRADVVLITGGLGPTYDDITRQAVAEYFDLPLEHDPKVAEQIRSFFRQRNRVMSENNLLQALVPRGATVLENRWGTAPGLYLFEKGCRVFLLPGVPREMKALFENAVSPFLKREDSQISLTRILRFYGVSESSLDESISDLLSAFPQTVLAPYAKDGEVELHVTAIGDSQVEAEEYVSAAEKAILERIGKYCYGFGDTSFEKCLVEKLSRLGLSVATAESCTGGMLSQRITAIPGASAVLSYGVCTYSEGAKKALLSVSEETLLQKGVYSEACALEMAAGIRRLSDADIGVGITGVAGPDGGDENNPVGTVYIALSSEKYNWVEKGFFATRSPDRDQIRRRACSKALSMLLSFCEKL